MSKRKHSDCFSACSTPQRRRKKSLNAPMSPQSQEVIKLIHKYSLECHGSIEKNVRNLSPEVQLKLLGEMIVVKRKERAEYFQALPVVCNVASIVRSYTPLLQGVTDFEVPTNSCLMNLSVHPVTNDLYMVDETRIHVRSHATGEMRILCGSSEHGQRDGPSDLAMFNWIGDLCFGGADSLYCTDFRNCQIRKVDLPSGHVTTIAGNAFGTRDGPGHVARFRCPAGITVGPDNDTLFVTDEFSIRRLRRDDDDVWHTSTLLTLDEDPGPIEYHKNRNSIFVTSSKSVFEIPLETLQVNKVATDLDGFRALTLDPQSGTFLLNGSSTLSRLACHTLTGDAKDEKWTLVDEEIGWMSWPRSSQTIAYDQEHHRLYATYTTKNVIMMEIY